MTDDTVTKSVNEDGEVDKPDTDNSKDKKDSNKDIGKEDGIDTKENAKENKQRSVSFNRDVHVKRFGKPRTSRGGSEQPPSIRKEPFTNLSEQELIDEANKVLAQAHSVTCTTDNPPDKFFSLPHRKKLREDKSVRRNSEDATPEGKTPLGRSTSDVSGKRRRERTSLSTLFRRAQRNKSPGEPVVVTTKPVAVVKRSKSDVSDLKSNTKLNTQTKPIRKRSGSETEEFLKSLRNKKSQLSPIIESSPREDYFKNTPPLEVYQKQRLAQRDSGKSEIQETPDNSKVNPLEKPPRIKTPEKTEPKPPSRLKRGKSSEKDKEKSPPISDTPKRKTNVKKTLLVDEIDSITSKNTSPVEVKDKIKESIKKIEENVYADRTMIHSSQKPPDKPPLTRGHTVNHMVKIIKEDQLSSIPKSHIISPQNGTNMNQPFSYIKPSVSPDANIFIKNSPDRVPSPVNKMTDKGVVYAQVMRDGDRETNSYKKYSPNGNKFGNYSDEDEGYEERYKISNSHNYDYEFKANGNENNFNSINDYKFPDSPIKPRLREFKRLSFDDLDMEPTYANGYPSQKDDSHDLIDKFRGRGDGMDTMKKQYEPETSKIDLDFNELSHRRQLLESRIKARRFDREHVVGEPISRYLAENDPIYEAEKRMKATEKYVNETVKYYRNTLERDGFAESTVTEDYSKYDSDNQKTKYNTESRTFRTPRDEEDRREFIDRLGSRYKSESKEFPPEPEYEPPSLESNIAKPVLTPDEYKEKKYKVKKSLTSSHDALQTGHKYKVRDNYIGKRKGHYASNPEIAQEREEHYANLPKYSESYHNSLRRMKNKDRRREEYGIKRHDSGDSRDYYERSPSRFDNRLVDSGIENDFRKDSGEIHKRDRKYESDDDVRNTSIFLDSERRHTEDNQPGEQIYANTDYLKYKNYRQNGYKKEYTSRERSADDGSRFDPKLEGYEKSPNRLQDKISAKPPKAKKLSGLEKMKQLFSRDSSKKSKKEKEVQPKTRTRVLKSPEHLATDDSEYKRYTDPEPSEIVVRKINYDCVGDERRIREDERRVHEDERRIRGDEIRFPDDEGRIRKEEYREPSRYRSPEIRDSDVEGNYRDTLDDRYNRTIKEERRYQERRDTRRYHSSERESDARPSDGESELHTKTRSSRPIDSPALAERYRGRRRLATPSPTPSPPRRTPAPAPATGGWFKSLDRLTRKKGKNGVKHVEKESIITTEDESSRKVWSKKPPATSPAKNLRFFGDTDPDSDANASHTSFSKTKSHPPHTKHNTLRKTISNSTNGLDEVDNAGLSNKSYSLSNLHRDSESPRNKQYYKRNLHNISEIQSNSEAESHVDRTSSKPPINPYDRSRSHSSSKTLKPDRRSGERGSSTDTRRRVVERSERRRVEDRGSSVDVRRRVEDRGSSSELRSSKQDIRDLKSRARAGAGPAGDSSAEDSSPSTRSVVYLHATTVGDIPDPGRISRNRSRDDVSSVNSSSLQARTTTKTFSIFAPWSPRHPPDRRDVHYAQKPRKTKKEIKEASSTKTLNDDRPAPLQRKSYSQTTLTRRPNSGRLTSSSQTLYRKPETRKETPTLRRSVARDAKKSQSSEIISRDGDREKVSRSVSMPRDHSKKAGWFKISSKNKKPEVNSRVR